MALSLVVPRMFAFEKRYRISLIGIALLSLTQTSHAGKGGGFTGGGLQGEYFANASWSGAPQFTRSDDRIQFQPVAEISWGGSRGVPFAGFPAHNFSVRWTGQLLARFSEVYTFKASCDDKFKLELKKASSSQWTSVIDQTSPSTSVTGTMTMEANTPYDVRILYAQTSGTARAVLKWSSAKTAEEVIDPGTEVALNWNAYREATFADAMKCGRPNWQIIESKDPQGMDENGWPTSDAEFIYSEMLAPKAVSPLETGALKLTFNGRAQVSGVGNVEIDASRPPVYDAGANITTVWLKGKYRDFAIATFRLNNTDRDGVYDANGLPNKDGVTNVKLMRPTSPDATTTLDDGMFSHPKFREAFDRMTAVRFQRVNDQAQAWSDRTKPNYGLWQRKLSFVYGARYGIPDATGGTLLAHEWEIMLCNELGADYYVTVPHLATDDYISKLAYLVRYGSDQNGQPYTAPISNPYYPPLNSNLNVYVEIANELWNSAQTATYSPFFDYRELIEDMAADPGSHPLFQILNYDNMDTESMKNGYRANNYTWVRRYWALRLKQISDLFRAVFPTQEMPGLAVDQPRVRPFFTWQYGDTSETARTGLYFMDAYYNNPARVSNPQPPRYFFYSGGGAGYYSSSKKDGFVEPNPIPNSAFEAPTLAADMAVAPAQASWNFTGAAGLARNVERLPIISATTFGTTQNNTDEWVGCEFSTGADRLTIYELGRWVSAGNVGKHEIRILRVSDKALVATATVNTSGATPGGYVYANCVPIALEANTTYLLLSKEVDGGDAFGNTSTVVATVPGITINRPVRASYSSTWTVTNETGAGHSYGPLSIRFSPSIALDGGSPLNVLNSMETQEADQPPRQIAWLHSQNGTNNGKMAVSLTLPASSSANNRYAFSYRSVARTQFSPDVVDSPTLKITVTVNGGVPIDITPRDSRSMPQKWTVGNQWKRTSFWVGDYYFTETFSAPMNAAVTLQFEISNTSGDHLAFLDDVRLTSSDAFYAGEVPAGGTAMGQRGGYLENLYNDSRWASAYGLVQMTYEHGFSAGGDSGNSPLQNYSRFYDLRARQSVIDALNIFQETGGVVPTYGSYTMWPVFEEPQGMTRAEGILNAGDWPLTQGIDDILAKLPETPQYGHVVPAVIPATGTNISINKGGADSTGVLGADNWFTYDILVAQPGTYAIGAESEGTGTLDLSFDGGRTIAVGAAGGMRGGVQFLSWGRHALRVRALSGSVTVKEVVVDTATAAPSNPGTFSAQIDVETNHIGLSWQDVSSGNSQELYYEIERSTDPAFATNVKRTRVGPNTTTWSDSDDLSTGITYYYRVRAVNAANSSSWVNLNNGSGIFVAMPAPRNQLFAYDSFDVAPSPLHGGYSETIGWNGAWEMQNAVLVSPTYEYRNTSPLLCPNLQVKGTSYAVGGYVFKSSGRKLDFSSVPYWFKRPAGTEDYFGADGTTVWMSALIRKDTAGNIYGHSATVGIISVTPDKSHAQEPFRQVGVAVNGDGYWSLRVRNAANVWQTLPTSVPAVVGETVFVVIRFDFSSADKVSLYVNPQTLGGLPPVNPSASYVTDKDITFRQIVFYPGSAALDGSLDEVRIGDSYAAVTPPVANPPVVEESFDYTVNSLVEGLAGGTGFRAPWDVESGINSPGFKIVSTSLAYPGIASLGNKAEGGYSYRPSGRFLDVAGALVDWKRTSDAYVGLDDTTLWISYLVRPATSSAAAKFSLGYGGEACHDNNGIVRVKNDAGTWKLSLLGDSIVDDTGVSVAANTTYLMVLRLDFGATDTVSLWVNPPLNSQDDLPAPDASLSTTNATFKFDELNWYPGITTATGWIDEIRFGDSYESVTPAP